MTFIFRYFIMAANVWLPLSSSRAVRSLLLSFSCYTYTDGSGTDKLSLPINVCLLNILFVPSSAPH